MNNELVQLTTEDVSKAIPITTSLIIAEKFEKRHDNVLKDIRELYERLKEILPKEDFGLLKIEETERYDTQNKKQIYYNLNEDFFLMLVMGYTGKNALNFKIKFIKAFKLMRNELLARSETRHIGKYARRSMTDSIKLNIPEGKFKSYAYGNYTALIYKKIFGKNKKQLKIERNVPENKNLRDYFTIEELSIIQDIESQIATIIEYSDSNENETYEKIKKFLENKKITNNLLTSY